MQVSRRKIEELRRHDSGPVHVTKEGLKRLHDQLARLKEKMPELAAEAQRTAAYGDRSDNAEYKEAKSTLRRAQGRIFGLEDQIRRAVVIEPGRNISGTVQLGSTVVLDAGGKQKTFQILGPNETDPAHGRISYKSPLGSALINKREGDVVKINPPAGEAGTSKEYKIMEIRQS
ncbi:MAG TPA: transcription elongation factor GreA [Candidatus Paceibacterota bacterium]|nr:transcription elongation factor GreA [Candidatus Paceibacterota bacterium]